MIEPYAIPLLVVALLATSLFFYARTLRLKRQLATLQGRLEAVAIVHEEKIQQIRGEQEDDKRQSELWRMRVRSSEQSYKARLYTHLLDHLATPPLRSEDFRLISKFVDQNVDAIGSKAKDLWMRVEEDQDSAEQRLDQLEEHLRRKLAKLRSSEESEESVSGEMQGKE